MNFTLKEAGIIVGLTCALLGSWRSGYRYGWNDGHEHGYAHGTRDGEIAGTSSYYYEVATALNRRVSQLEDRSRIDQIIILDLQRMISDLQREDWYSKHQY